MRLNPLQQKILSIIELLSLQNLLVKSTLVKISQIGLGATVTKM